MKAEKRFLEVTYVLMFFCLNKTILHHAYLVILIYFLEIILSFIKSLSIKIGFYIPSKKEFKQ